MSDIAPATHDYRHCQQAGCQVCQAHIGTAPHHGCQCHICQHIRSDTSTDGTPEQQQAIRAAKAATAAALSINWHGQPGQPAPPSKPLVWWQILDDIAITTASPYPHPPDCHLPGCHICHTRQAPIGSWQCDCGCCGDDGAVFCPSRWWLPDIEHLNDCLICAVAMNVWESGRAASENELPARLVAQQAEIDTIQQQLWHSSHHHHHPKDITIETLLAAHQPDLEAETLRKLRISAKIEAPSNHHTI